MKLVTTIARVTALLAFLAVLSPAHAGFKAQGPKLVANNEIGQSEFGISVSVSGDGNTAVVAGKNDNSQIGAAWIFTRNAGQWTQGPKLIASDSVGSSLQGFSVAISADGTTVATGGPTDNSPAGAVWIFTGSNGVWTQQGPKLIVSGAVGGAAAGASVALSADGNTVLIGGPGDNSSTGAAWVFTRNNSLWTQQGPKLVGSDAIGASLQGYFNRAVALSADGNTAIIGGPGDNSQTGAAWVFTRSNGAWTQQGNKLVGSGAVGAADQGSVALSADGNTAVIGGEADNNYSGAAWVFTRSNGVWVQQGSKINQVLGESAGIGVALSGDGQIVAIGSYRANFVDVGGVSLFTFNNGTWSQLGSNLVGSGSSGSAGQGGAIAFSADGSTILSGGPLDASNTGAFWAFIRFAAHDFNSDSYSDILWRNTSGDTTNWFMNGAQILSGVSLGNVPTAWSVVGTGDFNGDGTSDILWRNTEGDTTIWLGPFTTGHVASAISLGNVPTAWSVAGLGDFNGDGTSDILWRNTGGDATIWFMNGNGVASGTGLGNVPAIWSVAGTGDFNGDGYADILWHDVYGDVTIWEMSGGSIKQGVSLGNVATNWSIAGTGDFNGDGMSDILWRDTAGDVWIWLMNNGAVSQSSVLGNLPATWSVAQTGDFDGNGTSDILWIDTSGNVMIWFMNGFAVTSAVSLGNVGTAWSVQGANSD